MKVRGNVIVNAGEEAIRYDARARDGALSETWFSEHVEQGAGDLWRDLYASPWRSELWRQTFQEYETLSDDFSNPDSPDFIPNPANSTVSGNVAFDKDARLGAIDGAVERFSKIENNATYALSSLNGAFHGLKKGNYAFSERFLKRAKGEIQPLPLSEMGRY